MQPTFGKQLDRAMRAAGLKQLALAEMTGISQTTISRYVNDESKPDVEQVDQLAKACGVNRYALVGGTDIAGKYPAGIVTVDRDASTKWLAYFASALTNPSVGSREEIFQEAAIVRESCEGIRAFLYEPRFFTDPIFNKDVAVEQVYRIDHAQVSASHFLIFHARHPSFGAGQELEIARNAGIPVVLLQPANVTVSRMVLGSSARLHQVHFANSSQLRERLGAALEPLVTDLVYRQNGQSVASSESETFAARLRAARLAMKVDEETVSTLVGVQRNAIENFESGADPNPSLTILRRLAEVLRTTVAHLAEGVPARLEDYDPVVSASLANLFQFARENNITHNDSQKLWDAAHAEYKKARMNVAEARSSPVAVDAWRTRYEALKTGVRKPRQTRLIDD